MIVHLGGGGGADVSAATATDGNVLAGKTFFASASDDIQTGTMPNRGAVTITPSASAQTIAEGYHNGSGSVPAVSFTASNVLAGTTIAGTAGTMVNYSTTLLTSTSYSDTGSAIRLNTPSTGYMYAANTGIQITYANLRTLIGLTAAKMVSGNTILGLAGAVYPLISTTYYSSSNTTTISFSGISYSPTQFAIVRPELGYSVSTPTSGRYVQAFTYFSSSAYTAELTSSGDLASYARSAATVTWNSSAQTLTIYSGMSSTYWYGTYYLCIWN